MTRDQKTRAAIAAAFILAVYALACWVEPCDGYSCHNDNSTITE